MYFVSWDDGKKEKKVETIDEAMMFAKKINVFVKITNENASFELVGMFGVDTIKNGSCPDGVEYTWKKRRN